MAARKKAPRKRKKAPEKVTEAMVDQATANVTGEPTPQPAPPLRIVNYHPCVLPHTTCPHCESGWSRIYKTGADSPTMRYHECDRKHKYRSREV